MFADDTNGFYFNSDLRNLITVINTDLDKLSLWLKASRLNLSKTNFIMFGNKAVDISSCNSHIKIDGCTVVQVSTVKVLGIYIDNKLNWKEHISKISSTVSGNIEIIK